MLVDNLLQVEWTRRRLRIVHHPSPNLPRLSFHAALTGSIPTDVRRFRRCGPPVALFDADGYPRVPKLISAHVASNFSRPGQVVIARSGFTGRGSQTLPPT